MINFIEFFEQAPFSILLVEEGVIVNCNPECLRLFGAQSLNEIINNPVGHFIESPINDSIPGSTKNKIPNKFLGHLHLNGIATSIEVTKISEKTDAKRAFYVLKPVNDSDNLEKDEISSDKDFKGLVKGNQIHSFLDHIPDPIIEFDKDFKIIYANKSASEIIGVVGDVIEGKTLGDLGVAKRFVEPYENELKKVFNLGSPGKLKPPHLKNKRLEWDMVAQFDDKELVKSVITTGRAVGKSLTETDNFVHKQEKLIEAIKSSGFTYFEYYFSDGKIILSNSLRLLIGENDQKEIIISFDDFVERFVYLPDQKKLRDHVNRAGGSGEKNEDGSVECRLLGWEGKLIHMLCNFRFKYDASRQPEFCFGIAQDVTILRDTEEKLQGYNSNLKRLIDQQTAELQRSEEKLSDALKLGNLTTWEFDFKTKKFYGGGEIRKILGPVDQVDENVMEVDNFQKLVHPDDLPIYFGSFERALRTKDKDYLDYIEYRIIRSDGSVRNLYLSVKIEIDDKGRHTRHYGTIQDITAIRKTEQEKDRLTSIIEVTPDIVAILDSKGGLIYLNQSGRYFYGLTENDSVSDINFIEIQAEGSQKILNEVCFPGAIKNGIWTGEIELVGKNNQKVPVSMAIVSHFGPDGENNSYSTIIRNISAQKKTEQDLTYKNAELDTFVYRASHDLRGPISSLLGLYQIVQFEIHDKKALEFFDMFNKQILRLNEIILALINLTKIKESTAANLPIDFSAIINDAMDSLRHLERFSDIKFNVKIVLEREFRSDKGLITTILQNLIENSIKYSRRNVESYANINIETSNYNTLLIRVEDNGIGIGKEIQHRVFDMFFRGHEISKGSGLGLYILKNAVEKLKGEIKVEGIANEGTSFFIELPFLE